MWGAKKIIHSHKTCFFFIKLMIHTTFNRSITAGSRGAGPRKNGVWGVQC